MLPSTFSLWHQNKNNKMRTRRYKKIHPTKSIYFIKMVTEKYPNILRATSSKTEGESYKKNKSSKVCREFLINKLNCLKTI